MMKEIQSVVLVTGGSTGIGKATCELLASRGFTVYGTSRQPGSEENNLPYTLLNLDISSNQSVKQCIKEVMDRSGRIDVLINNAGYIHCGSLVDTTVDDLIQQYNVNVFGAMRMIQSVVPHMLARGEGHIINIGSIGGRLPLPFQGAYSSSKAALMNLSDSLKIELLKDGIKVSLVEPGDTNTEINQNRQYSKGFHEDPLAVQSVQIMQQSEKNGVQPVKVAATIYKAITSREPKQRYVVGSDARLVNFLNRLLPSFLRRKLIMSLYRVPEKNKD